MAWRPRETSAAHVERILLFCGGPTFYGKEIVTLRLALGLRDTGWKPEFITSNWNNPDVTARLQSSRIPCHFLWMGFISATLKLRPLLDTWGQLQRWTQLVSGFKRLAGGRDIAAIIHTNWHHALLLLPVLSPARDIFWLHEMLPQRPRFAYVFRAIGRRVNKIVCVSQAVARSVEALGVPPSKIRVIHNGLEVRIGDRWPGPGLVPSVGIVGQIAPWKGHDDLVEAIGLLAQRGIRVSLSIFGEGTADYVASLKRRIATACLDDDVQWCGFVGDAVEIYRSIDICVVPTRSDEPLGMSAIEASAAGLPVVCSDRGGLPEIVEHGTTGFVVKDRRPDQLAQAIAMLVARPELSKSMGTAGRQRASELFSLARFVAEFGEVIWNTPNCTRLSAVRAGALERSP